jgi:hypothetical protein
MSLFDWFRQRARSSGPQSPAINVRTGTVNVQYHAPENAGEIAEAVADKLRMREAFTRDLNSQIHGIFAIISLSEPITEEYSTRISSVIQISNSLNKDRASLFFGFRPDDEQWVEIPGNKTIVMHGVRSTIWTFPRQSDQNTKVEIVDNFLVYRFDQLDRLEAGCLMESPFRTIRDLDYATVMLKATGSLIERITLITLIVNDYIIFELSQSDIVGWIPPPPPLVAQIVQGTIDHQTGKLHDKEAVTTVPMNPNFMMPETYWEIPFYIAAIAPRRASGTPPLNNAASINFADSEIRVHRLTSGPFIHRAGNGSLMVMPGEHGWLPRK